MQTQDNPFIESQEQGEDTHLEEVNTSEQENVIDEDQQVADEGYDWRSSAEGDIEQPQTEPPPLYQIAKPKSRPWLRLFVVSGGTLIALIFSLVAFLIFNSITTARTSPKEKKEDVSKYKQYSSSSRASDPNTLYQLSNKNVKEDLHVVNKGKSSKSKPKGKPGSNPETASGKPVTPKNVIKPKIIYSDRPPEPIPEPPPPPPPKVEEKIVYRDRPVSASTRPSQVKEQYIPPSNPYERWEQLAGIGVVGGGDVVPSSVETPTYDGAPTNDTIASNSPYPTFGPDDFSGEMDESLEDYKPDIDLPLGTRVKGKILHDVGFNDGAPVLDTAVIELLEPLGEIPKGAMISAQIDSVDDSGSLSMSMLGYEANGFYQTASMPEIQITSSSATRKRNQFGKIAKEVLGVGLDILSDETGQDIEFENGRVSSISTDSGSGFLDRSIDTVSSRLLEENRSRGRVSAKAPRIKAGSKVTFIVNQSFQ